MSCREYLLWHRESSYGTADLNAGAPKTGAYHYIRLDQGDSFQARGKRVTTTIPYGGGFAVPYLRVGKVAEVAGSFRTILHYSQAANLLGWAMTPVNAGRTTPWTTTDASSVMPVGDLASASIYHAKMRSDGTFEKRAYRGCKVRSLRLECSAGSPLVIASFDIIAIKPVPNDDLGGADSTAISTTEFPGPTVTSWPTDPVLFQESTGGVKIGTTRTLFEELSFDIQNVLDPKRYESRYVQTCRMLGRNGMLSTLLHYKSTPDDRSAFNGLTAQDCEVAWTNGVNTVKVDFNTAAIIDNVEDRLPLEGEYQQRVSVASFYDGAASADITFTYT
jgi:hypothetical protein